MMDDLSGKVIKSYELRELIGQGGFGAVYRAYQTLVKREVAVKIILPEFANQPDFIRRFEAEAQLVARLEHLHIVPLYDYWREPDSAYLVMRWLRGSSLQESIKRGGPWALEDTARLLEQISAALAAAHRNGVIHRDMKPANILLDEEKNAYLSDFGIAKDLTDSNQPEIEIVGSFAYMSPEQIQQQAITPQTDIYGLGVVLFELLTGERPFATETSSQVIYKHLREPLPSPNDLRPELPDGINDVIQRATDKDPLSRYPNTLAMAAAFRRALGDVSQFAIGSDANPSGDGDLILFVPDGLDTATLSSMLFEISDGEIGNPYKGLRAFQEADVADFFGREALTTRLLGRLVESSSAARFLAVIGPSGSGKSSVVRAGIIPALRRGELPGSERWFVVDMVPGTNPFDNLLSALLSVSILPPFGMAEMLRQDEDGLSKVVNRILPPDEGELLLVIDQFEEVFTQVEDEAERSQFLNSVRAATTAVGSRARVIVTLRADFYDRPLLYSEFGDLIRQRTEIVLPLSPEELERAIVGPAERVGLTVESGLVAAVVADLREEPGALPLLQYALTEVFERRDERKLTLEAYRASGGALGALSRRAEDVYVEMDGTHQQMARQLFLRLVTPGEESDDTRRRIRWAEMLSITDNPDVMQSVLDLFGKYRLLTFDNDPETREPTIEIAHEALIRRWARLRGWLDDTREALQLRRRLTTATEEWLRQNCDLSFLVSGTRLDQFESLASAGTIALSRDEIEFVQASVHRREALQAEEDARRKREAALEKQAKNRLRGLVAIFAAAAVIAAILSAFAFNQRQVAQENFAIAAAERDRANLQSRISKSRELAVRSQAALGSEHLDLALLLGLAAEQTQDTLEARSSLLASVLDTSGMTAILNGHTDRVRAVVFSPDGHTLASIGRDNTLRFWNAATHQPLDGLSAIVLPAPPWSVAYNQTLMATGLDDGSIQLLDAATGERVGDALTGHNGAVYTVTFSSDGLMLASGGEDGTVRLWDATTLQAIGEPLTGHTDAVWGLAFSPDGQTLASGSADGTIRLWNTTNREQIGEPMMGHTNWVMSVAFSPDGRSLASGSADETAILWAKRGDTFALSQVLAGHHGWVRDVAFSTDGSTVATASADKTVMLWDAETGQSEGSPLTGHEDEVWSVAFRPDQHTLASAGADGKIIVWNPNAGSPLAHAVATDGSEVRAVAFLPDGQTLASVQADDTLHLWSTSSPESQSDPIMIPEVVTLAASPTNGWLALGEKSGEIQLWDTANNQPVASPLTGHQDIVLDLAFSPDGSTLASASQDGTVILWDTTTGTMKFPPLTGHETGVSGVAFAPDGRLVAAGGQDGTIRLWDAVAGKLVRELERVHTDQVTAVAFSPDGQMLASGSWDKTIILWDVATGQPLGQPLTGHSDWVLSVAFGSASSLGGGLPLLASASADKTIILWDINAQQPIGQPLSSGSDWIQSLDFNPDGSRLAAGSKDGSIVIWDTTLSAWQERARQVANRDFSDEERAQFGMSDNRLD
jgi:WD40 repeat protein/serine/threonine protein kinase